MAAIFENENGQIASLPDKLKALLDYYGVRGWAEAYDDFDSYASKNFGQMLTEDALPSFLPQPPTFSSLDDVQCWANTVWEVCDRLLDSDLEQWIPPFDFEGAPNTATRGSEMAEEGACGRQKAFLTILLVFLYNLFSCMVHRKTLFQLVYMAKKGNDGALVKAVQIDKTCLADVPSFRQRVEQLTKEGNVEVLAEIAKAYQKPMFQSGTTLSDLYIVFALLDTIGLLEEFSKDKARFADFCQSIGAYGPKVEEEAVDLQSFEKAYFRFKRNFMSVGRTTPIRSLVVKDMD